MHINTTTQPVAGRILSLDALRGLAMLLMVLSGSIAFGGVLPAWMYHMQVPPPRHVFVPGRAGITWVDLVFPFFLFAMGAALPLALKRKFAASGAVKTIGQLMLRYALLLVFAYFTFYARPANLGNADSPVNNLMAIAAFGMLFLMYGRLRKQYMWLQYAALAVAVAFMALFTFKGGFSFEKTDIIIVVLGNMALFGGVIWLATRHNQLLRIGLLPFIMGVFVAAKVPGSWNMAVFNLTPATWAYKFYFLKYLFIVLPGTVAGELMMGLPGTGDVNTVRRKSSAWLPAGCAALVVVNLFGLYTRLLALNLAATLVVSAWMLYSVKQKPVAIRKMVHYGVYALLLGLTFEAWEGGIKKDISTYSYYFVTTGLAFTTLAAFTAAELEGYGKKLMAWLAANGRNPMITYTAGNLLLIPLMRITRTDNWLNLLNTTAAGGLARGLVFTTLVACITVWCTKHKIFWKT